MVIPLLGVKTRCADKSTAEHFEHTYSSGMQRWRVTKSLKGHEAQVSFRSTHHNLTFTRGLISGHFSCMRTTALLDLK